MGVTHLEAIIAYPLTFCAGEVGLVGEVLGFVSIRVLECRGLYGGLTASMSSELVSSSVVSSSMVSSSSVSSRERMV